MTNIAKSLRTSIRQLDEMERFLPLHHVRIESISKWTVGQQIEHAVAASRSIVKRFDDTTPLEGPQRKLSMAGRVVMLLGVIPRGRGRAPEATQPRDLPLDELKQRITALRDELRRRSGDTDSIRTSTVRFPHPYFGLLNVAQWTRFVEIHQKHHLKIVREIASASLR